MTDTRIERRLGWVTQNQQEYPDLKPEDWQAAIRQRICPLCGAGPFVMPATHVNRKHGIDRFQLRDLMGIYYSESICDPDYAKAISERSKRLHAEGRTGIGPPSGPRKRRGKAWLALQKEKAQKVDRVAIGRTVSANAKIRSADRDARIAEMLEMDMTYQEIGAAVGLHPKTVAIIARDRGYSDEDGRTRYSSRRRELGETEELRRARLQYQENRAAERERRIAFIRNGGTVEELAVDLDWTSDIKNLRYWLKQQGIDVPDGRARGQEMLTFVCPECKQEATKVASQVRANRKQGWAGPYCSGSCAAKARARRQGWAVTE